MGKAEAGGKMNGTNTSNFPFLTFSPVWGKSGAAKEEEETAPRCQTTLVPRHGSVHLMSSLKPQCGECSKGIASVVLVVLRHR